LRSNEIARRKAAEAGRFAKRAQASFRVSVALRAVATRASAEASFGWGKRRQAAALHNKFRYMAVLCVACIPVVFALKRVKPKPGHIAIE
jgi:hypothetical protein